MKLMADFEDLLADDSNSNLEEAGHGADEAPASQAPANGDSGGGDSGGDSGTAWLRTAAAIAAMRCW